MRGNGAEVLGRKERAQQFGVDVPSELVWPKWEVGGDFKQTLVIKNVGKECVVVSYKLPASKLFFMNFPDARRLSPGLALPVDVSFRPAKREYCEQLLEFTVSSGSSSSSNSSRSFFIRLRATLPEQSMRMTQSLDFGFCPLRELQTREFEVVNDGEVEMTFRLKAPPSLGVAPSGVISLKPFSKCACTCTFNPSQLRLVEEDVQCVRDNGPPLVMKVTGVGKLPFIKLSCDEIDFGSVITHEVVTRKFTVLNQSQCGTSFEQQAVDASHDAVLTCTPEQGFIGVGGSQEFVVTYKPIAMSSFDLQRFQIKTPGGNTVSLTAFGKGLCHEVSIDPPVINFGDVALIGKEGFEVAQLQRHPVTLYNKSSTPAHFQFLTEAKGIFKFSVSQGVIAAQSSLSFEISFKPLLAINYSKRIWCAVRNSAPIAIDLLGTGFTEKQRPVVFDIPMLEQYRSNLILSGSDLGNALMPSIHYNRTAVMSQLGIHDEPGAKLPLLSPIPGDKWNEFFIQPVDSKLYCSLQQFDVDFGSSSLGLTDPRYLTLINNSGDKLQVSWNVPPDPLGSLQHQASRRAFEIYPDIADVAPHGSVQFKVAFRPTLNSQYYVHYAEAVVMPKAQRNFRLVEPQNFIPPLFVEPLLIGHTFAPGAPQFVSQTVIHPKKVRFSQIAPHERAYATVQFINNGDTASVFQIEKDPSGQILFKPESGIVYPKSFAIVCVQYMPTQVAQFSRRIKVMFNNDAVAAKELDVFGICAHANLTLSSKTLLIPPTCIGAITKKRVKLTNPGAVTTTFEWNIPETYSDLLSVSPATGTLGTGASVDLEWSFCPRRIKCYNFQIGAKLTETVGELGYSTESKQLFLGIVGEGTVGTVSLNPSKLDLGVQLVGSRVEKQVWITNDSDVFLRFNLTATDITIGSDGENTVNFDPPSGTLPAKSKRQVLISFFPLKRRYYDIEIRCRLGTGSNMGDTVLHSSLRDQADFLAPMLPLSANVVYPTMAVVDARAEGLSAGRLFRDLRLVQLNSILCSDLSERECAYNAGTIDETDPEKVLEVLPFEFRSRNLNDPPSVIRLMLRNTGVLPTSFKFVFPKDGEDEPENWVDSDLLSQKELTRNLILENRLFQVFPKEGRLDANHEIEILICYQHKFVGDEFRLPVILQIVDGKAVVLAFTGCTLDYNTPRLEVLPSPPPFEPGSFGFRDVALGVDNPPVQYMQLRNSSDVAIDWALDVSDIERLNSENFDFGVFELLDAPMGVIEPGELAFLRFVFRPLEEKQYSAQVSFTIVGDGGRVNVLLVGSGYVPKRDELPNELSIPLPQKQLIKIPNQPVLSFIERLAMGAIPTGCRVSGIVVLQNVHKKPWAFNWQVQASSLASEAVTIIPPHGELLPGDVILCTVSVLCSGPMWFDTDVQCLISEPILEEAEEELADDTADKKPDTAGTVKSSSLKVKGRQFRESVITRTIGHTRGIEDKKDTAGGVKFKETDSFAGGNRSSPDSRSVHSNGSGSKTGGSKFSGNSKASGTSSGLNTQARTVQQMAIPGTSYDHCLYISVQAHSREPMLHRDIFGNLDEYWIDRAMPLPPPQSTSLSATQGEPHAGQILPDQQKDADFQKLTEDLMHALLNDIVGDADVSAALKQLPVQPTYKYVQLTTRPLTPYRLTTPCASPRVDLKRPSDAAVLAGDMVKFNDAQLKRMQLLAGSTPEFMNFSHFVLESCLTAICTEAAMDEWNWSIENAPNSQRSQGGSVSVNR